MPHSHRERNRQLHSSTLPLYLNSIIGLLQTGSHPVMVGDMSRVTLNFDLSKILLLWISSQDQDLHSHQKHAHLLVLIWERLQMPTSTTTPDATVQPLGWHIANKLSLALRKLALAYLITVALRLWVVMCYDWQWPEVANTVHIDHYIPNYWDLQVFLSTALLCQYWCTEDAIFCFCAFTTTVRNRSMCKYL